jgi:hypothetical protein
MGGKRSGGKPPGSKIQKRRTHSNDDRLYSLANSVSTACDAWLLKRGLKVDHSAWAKTREPRIDFQLRINMKRKSRKVRMKQAEEFRIWTLGSALSDEDTELMDVIGNAIEKGVASWKPKTHDLTLTATERVLGSHNVQKVKDGLIK